MKQTWRWFGPDHIASMDDLVQSGVEGVVSALHHIPTGDVWSGEEIATRQQIIGRLKNGNPSGLRWDVAESLPVSEDIKKQIGGWREHIANYKTSMENLANAGLEVICYNFMPVLDWTRTDLAWRLPHGGTCMRFDYFDFAAFDLFILKRAGAKDDFPPDVVEEAEKRYRLMSEQAKDELARNITCGLPGAAENFSLEDVRMHLAEYDGISQDRLRANFVDFLEQVIPTAEKLGMRLCCHPDDPPFGLLGLPRIMSTEADYKKIMGAVDVSANGITLCSGSLGARADNDLPGMMRRLGSRVHFLHLRNVQRDEAGNGANFSGSFHESEHLDGATDMVALIAEIVREEASRKAAGRKDHQIPMRPDHGHDILEDLGRTGQPGYPIIGRLRGLAELRGIMQVVTHPEFGI
ncbi:MAG: mannonate dehydratase [Rhizobiaceae bacterium]|nr:mannonate dehydratase [Rhizobiaceae bacterium]